MTSSSHEAERRWPGFGAAVEISQFTSVHALPMRLRTEIIGAMNIFLARPGALSDEDVALGQGLADIATIGLLQERAVKEQHVVAEQLQGALNSRVLIEQALDGTAGASRLDAHGSRDTPGNQFIGVTLRARRPSTPRVPSKPPIASLGGDPDRDGPLLRVR